MLCGVTSRPHHPAQDPQTHSVYSLKCVADFFREKDGGLAFERLILEWFGRNALVPT